MTSLWREAGDVRGSRRRESGDERVRLTPLSLGHGIAVFMFRSHATTLVRLFDSVAGRRPPVASAPSPAVSHAAVRSLLSLHHLSVFARWPALLTTSGQANSPNVLINLKTGMGIQAQIVQSCKHGVKCYLDFGLQGLELFLRDGRIGMCFFVHGRAFQKCWLLRKQAACRTHEAANLTIRNLFTSYLKGSPAPFRGRFV